ncbi:MAG TPA: hypothetical protein ENF38_01335 [Candidatus Aenigmarchaeota archaeon]|nr:hypothetical protein [Candidatus Aenigmarchaeota archaeon]
MEFYLLQEYRLFVASLASLGGIFLAYLLIKIKKETLVKAILLKQKILFILNMFILGSIFSLLFYLGEILGLGVLPSGILVTTLELIALVFYGIGILAIIRRFRW